MLELKKLIVKLKTEILFRSESIGDMIQENESFEICRLAIRRESFSCNPKQAMLSVGPEIFRAPEDQALYSEFVTGLGATDTQGQEQHMELCTALLEHNLEEARENRLTRSKLFVALGLFGGITLCLVLL